MKYPTLLFLSILFFNCSSPKNQDESISEIIASEEINTENIAFYELRTYFSPLGKSEDLLARFRNHTTSIFENHGMKNIAYWVPADSSAATLVYLLGFTSKEDRDNSFEEFRKDPEWIKVKEDSEVNGALVDSVQSIFLTLTDYSPSIFDYTSSNSIFEMRTYHTNEGKLSDLHNRFRNHTMKIFENNQMANVAYFNLYEGQRGVENTLIYFISHENRDKATENWSHFGEDPDWKSAYSESIKNGTLVNHLESVYLYPTDFSPIR